MLATAQDDERLQPAFLLIHRDLGDVLVAAVAGETRRLGAWVQAQGPALVDAQAAGWTHALRGANDALELTALEAILGQIPVSADGGE